MSFAMAILRPLAYLSVPYFALKYLSSRSTVARYYIRVGIFISTLGLCSAWGLVIAASMSIAGKRYDVNHIIGRCFYLIAGRLLGIKIVVEGEEHLHGGPAVLIGNHQSMLDILYLGAMFPRKCSIMAKKEIQWTPILGQWMSLSGTVFIDRSNNKSAVRSLAEAGASMKAAGNSLWLFPEGTRSMAEKSAMKPFKKGAFHLAIQSGLPIIPVVCENYWKLYRPGHLESGTLTVKVMPPIRTDDLKPEDAGDLAVRMHESMLAVLKDISGERPQPATAEQSTPTPTAPLSPSTHPIPLEQPSPGLSHRRNVGGDGSTDGFGTEEDEGMVLVGRP